MRGLVGFCLPLGGLGAAGAVSVLDQGLLWFVAHTEAGQAPRAGCPGPSPSAAAGRPGSPQGALCATAGAGATAGSASAT